LSLVEFITTVHIKNKL